MVLPYSRLVLVRVDDQVHVADRGNKYLTGDEVVPMHFLDDADVLFRDVPLECVPDLARYAN